MADIKPMSRIADAWDRRSQASTPDYEAGVRDPKTDWGTATLAAEDNYNKGVQAAIQQKRFGAGVRSAGTEKWQKNAMEKGVARWAEGIRLARDAYVKGFQPYADVIARTSLPARGPKGDPKNYERVRVIGTALHNAKVSRTK